MRITEYDMESRKRVAALQSDLTDAIGKHVEKITYIELLKALNDCSERWIGCMLKDEREEENRKRGD